MCFSLSEALKEEKARHSGGCRGPDSASTMRENETRRHWLDELGGLHDVGFTSEENGRKARPPRIKAAFFPGTRQGFDARSRVKNLFTPSEQGGEQGGEQVMVREIWVIF